MTNLARMGTRKPRGRVWPGSFAALIFLPVVFFVVFSLLSSHAAPPAVVVWLVDGKTVKRIDTQTNRITLNLQVPEEPKALAVTVDGSVWVATEDSLLKFDLAGQPLGSVLLKSLMPSLKGKHLVLDPYDQSLWVGGEKTLVHLDAQAKLLKTWQAPAEIKALSLDTDQTPWVLTEKQLLHLSVQTAVLHTQSTDTLLKEPKHLLIDGLAGLGWLAGEHGLIRLDLHDLGKAPLSVALPKDTEIEALALHPLFGTLYAATDKQLLIYDRNGQLLNTLDLAPFKLDDDLHLLVEPQTGSLWLGGKKRVVRMTTTGAVEASLALEKETEALAAGPFQLLPTLTLLAPAENSITNNPRPLFRLGLGAECNAVPCTLVDAYLNSLILSVDLNGIAVGPLFTLGNGEATFTPAARLPEGLNTWSAVATDIFGHTSNTINSRFTVTTGTDTVPPVFLSLS
ncbi:MAG: hypothetical protein HY942_06610, partial [Gammaproteobacteria bacterium]|nr:hypothetical protein [Gammaproteobacteria bacterium]